MRRLQSLSPCVSGRELHYHEAGRCRRAVARLDAAPQQSHAKGGGMSGTSTAPKLQNVRIDQDRLWQSLMEMAKIGATQKGGSKRLALTDLDKEGRDLFVKWCKAAGCTVTVDRMGNIFARRRGRRDDLPPVVTGSHLDTQPTGGKFDGVYGVLAGIEALQAIRAAGLALRRPVEVAAWMNEEGSRFAPGMMGSAAFAGATPLANFLNVRDA